MRWAAADHRTSPVGYLFSPASCYPSPVAYVVDHHGAVVHSWSHRAHQPRPEDDPPNYLRGWNHVEMDAAGNLFAIVPLRSLIKLTPTSELAWSCDVTAHHDLALTANGTVMVLAEAPRLVEAGKVSTVVLDNAIATITAAGVMTAELSLYDLLRTDRGLRDLIDTAIHWRSTAFRLRGWPSPSDAVPDAVADETLTILRTGRYDGDPRRASQLLRALPGSPCDILHTNTLEVLAAHPGGLWSCGDMLACMRELNVIAVISPSSHAVRWWWGPGELSGPHQPTMLPDGSILVFDNGRDQQRTRLVVVEPTTSRVTWRWTAQPPESFFCPLAGGCEPLPNGNLLVTNSTAGAAFELTWQGRVVWRLTLPVEVYGADRGRVSIYRMSAVPVEILDELTLGKHAGGDAVGANA